MKYIDINQNFTAKVAEYIAKGYTINTATMSGSQGEVAHVDLTDGKQVVRVLRRAGGIVNDSCGMHVHVDASKHTPQSLKNVLSIMYSKEDILFAALKVNPARIDSYCQAVDEPILEEIRKLPSGASMDQLKDRWYQGRDGSDYHYHSSRYRACYAQKKVMRRIF